MQEEQKAKPPVKVKIEPIQERKAISEERTSSAGHVFPFALRKLKRHLEKEGISTGELSRTSGVSQGRIGNYLCGRNKPGTENRRRICKALNKPLNWLNG